MPINICKNCKWWGIDYAGACDFVNTTHAENGDKSVQIKMYANDDSGLESMLLTARNFSCCHFIGLKMNNYTGNKNALKPDSGKNNSNLHMRVKKADKDRWKTLAAKEGLTLAKWVLSRLNN